MTCKVKIVIGDVEVVMTGPDLADVVRRATRLMRQAAAINAATNLIAEDERPPIGFAAHIERAPEFVDRDRNEWFEESP
jgi:hypothetical protein